MGAQLDFQSTHNDGLSLWGLRHVFWGYFEGPGRSASEYSGWGGCWMLGFATKPDVAGILGTYRVRQAACILFRAIR